MSKATQYSQLSDQELVVLIKENQDYLGEVYKRCKQYSISFLRKMTSNKLQDYELDDIFHDSILVLYEKILKGDFVLTASIQVYLNSVCRFQLLNKFKNDKRNIAFDDGDSDGQASDYNKQITDCLDDIENPKEAQFLALEKALEKMKTSGERCYEILILFWYQNKSHNEIASIMNYSNDKTSKKQKSGCQEKLRTMAFNEMNIQ
ncbi:MAG: sigma-70 family RNA polymerase sigma factor [Flavobacterium sp.]|nr:sigma-70 family RNA polymerase sigma factor [Flavobacterium sp.]